MVKPNQPPASGRRPIGDRLRDASRASRRSNDSTSSAARTSQVTVIETVGEEVGPRGATSDAPSVLSSRALEDVHWLLKHCQSGSTRERLEWFRRWLRERRGHRPELAERRATEIQSFLAAALGDDDLEPGSPPGDAHNPNESEE